MIDKKIFFKLPINFKDKCLVYPPTIKEIIEDDDFYFYVKVLTISQEELEDEFLNKLDEVPTPIEFLLNGCYNDKDFEEKTRKAFNFFIKKEVSFIYENKSILIGNLEESMKNINSLEDLKELSFIEEEDFFDFQNLIRRVIGQEEIDKPNPNENIKIKKMKAKARYRDKVKAKQGLGISFETLLISICCMGIGITPLNIGEISYATLYDLVKTYQNKEKYELEMNMIMAGADSKKIKPEYWIRN